MKKPEIVQSKNRDVSCDGGNLDGHPVVYLKIGQNDHVVCPYCSRKFIFSKIEF